MKVSLWCSEGFLGTLDVPGAKTDGDGYLQRELMRWLLASYHLEQGGVKLAEDPREFLMWLCALGAEVLPPEPEAPYDATWWWGNGNPPPRYAEEWKRRRAEKEAKK